MTYPRRHAAPAATNVCAVEALEARVQFAGNGLAAAYFAGTDLAVAKLGRTDLQINFDWSHAPPTAAVGPDYSVRWSGRLQTRYTEHYRLVAYVAGGVRLWANKTLIIDDWSPHALRSSSGYADFEAGKRYDLRFEYRHDQSAGSSAVAKLYWESSSQLKQLVPASFLYSALPDATAPTAPTRLRPSYLTDTAIKMIWDPSSDPSGLVYYNVYFGKTKLDTVTDPSYTRAGRTPGTTYSFTVIALDAFGNSTAASTMVSTAALAPSAGGTGFAAKYYAGSNFDTFTMTRTDASINFDWSSGGPIATNDGSYSALWQGYLIPKYSEVYTLSFTSDDGARLWVNNNLLIDHWSDHAPIEDAATIFLRPGTTYSTRIEYHNSGGPGRAQLSWASLSQAKQIVPATQVTAPFTDKTAPTSPGNLAVTAVTTNSVTLDWNASTDDVGVAFYDVYRGTQKIATVNTPGYTDSGLSPATLYQYKVVAIDGAQHSSPATAPVSATTNPAATSRDALSLIYASSYDAASGVNKSGNNITGFDSGDWIKFSNLDFHGGVGSVKIALAVPTGNLGGSIQLRLDSTSGPVVGSLIVQPTGSFATYYVQQTEVSGASGIHTLYLIGRDRSNLANVQSIQFRTASLTRIMSLGDSITQEFTFSPSWRYYLWHQLQDAGAAVDFVGSQIQATDGYAPNLDFDQNHEGHSGWTTSQILAQAQTFAQNANPDIVLLHIGTNDLRFGQSPQSAINNIGQIIDVLRAVNPNVKIVLAQIIPAGDAPAGSVQAFNALIPGLAASKNSAQSPVVVVDQYTGFNLATDSDDALHPNDAGDRLMADRWYAALSELL